MWSRTLPLTGIVAFGASTIGCHSWQVQHASPELLVQQQHPTAVQVRRIDGKRFRLNGPTIVRDTLVGIHSGKDTRIPLTEIESVALRRFSAGRTTPLVLGIPAGLVGLAAVGCATSNCGY